MQYIRGSQPTVRAETDNEAITVPYLGDVGDARSVPQALSGYDRADWFARNTIGVPTARARATMVSATGRADIGANERGVDDTAWTDSYWTGYNVVNYPEQYTEQADSVGSIWGTQTQASQGLNYLTWDQVYVDQDTQSVWS